MKKIGLPEIERGEIGARAQVRESLSKTVAAKNPGRFDIGATFFSMLGYILASLIALVGERL